MTKETKEKEVVKSVSVYASLHRIQKALKAPKEKNANVSYKSRSAEQILEAAKEFLGDGEVIILNDEIVNIGNRFYVKATAQLWLDEKCVSSVAFAREPDEILSNSGKPMMQVSQVTGASSSYARKYALGGLLAIDDSKDDQDKNEQPVEEKPEVKQIENPFTGDEFVSLQREIEACTNKDELGVSRDKASAAKPRMTPEQMKAIGKWLLEKEGKLTIADNSRMGG